MLAAGLGFMLSGGFGFGYSSMRIHLLHFAMRVFRLHHSSNSPQNCGPLSVLMLTGMPWSTNHSSRMSLIVVVLAFLGIGAAIGHPEYLSMPIR